MPQYRITGSGQRFLNNKPKSKPAPVSAPTREDIDNAQPYGLDPGWDYKTADRGPDGQSQTRNQQGWDPHGRAYYGPGVGGYLTGVWDRLTQPIGETPELEDIKTKTFTFQPPQTIRDSDSGNDTEITLPSLSSLANTLAGRASNLGREPGTEVTGDIGSIIASLPTFAGRGASEFIRGGLTLLQQPAIGFERYVSPVATAIQEIGDTSPLPAPLDVNLPKQLEFLRKDEKVANFLSYLSGYNLLRAVTSKRPLEELVDITARNFEAGRIAYTNLIAPVVREEYLRRVASGEDPILLAMELENPIAEAIGQSVLDPLNLLGIGLGRARDARRISSVGDEFIKFADDGVRLAYEGLNNVGEARAVSALEDLVIARMASIKKTAAGLDDFAKDTSAFALVTEGKRFNISRSAEEMTAWISHNSDGPEEALEVLRGLALSAGDDADEVIVGLDIMNNFKAPQPLYSSAGERLGIILRGTIGENPQKFLDDLADVTREGDIAKLVEHVDKKMGPVIDKMLPSLGERIAEGEDINIVLQGLNKFDTLFRSNVMRPVNSFFASVYMGMTPGYAIRNLITNTLHIFVDQGPGAFRFGPKKWGAVATDWLGGRTPKAFGFGAVSAADVKPSRKFYNFFLKKSEDIESGGRMQVIGHTIDREMRKMMRPGRSIPDVKPLTDLGLSDDSATLLQNLMVEHKGNIKAVRKAFLDMAKTGSADTWRSVSNWADAEDIVALERLGLFDDVSDVLKADNVEQAASRLQTILNDIREEAAKIDTETAGVPKDAPMIPSSVAFGEARDLKLLSDQMISATQSRYAATSNALYDYQYAVSKFQSQIFLQIDPNDVELVRAAEKIVEGYRDIDLLPQVARRNDQIFVDDVWKITREIRKMSPDTNWDQVWRTLPFTDAPPAGLTKDKILKAYWEDYIRPSRDRFWIATRDEVAISTEAMAKEMGILVGVDPNTALFRRARQSYKVSLQFDGAEILKDNLTYRFGVGGGPFEVGAEQGINNSKHLLNAINDNLAPDVEKFDNLWDVPQNVADAALLKRADARAAEVLKAADEVTIEQLLERGFPQDIAEEMVGGKLESAARDAFIRNAKAVEGETVQTFDSWLERIRQQDPSAEDLAQWGSKEAWIDNLGLDETLTKSLDEIAEARGLRGPIQVDDAPPGVTVDRPKRVFEMSRKEYLAALDETRLSDAALEVELFGEEGAELYKKAQRTINSPQYNPRVERFREADEIIERLEGSLNEVQKNALFGIGEEGFTHDELVEFRRAFDPIDDAPQDFLVGQVSRSVTRVEPQKIRDALRGAVEFSPVEELAFIQSREAIRILSKRGLSADDILELAGQRLAEQVGEDGARTLLDDWIRFAKGESAPQLTVSQASGREQVIRMLLDEQVEIEKLVPPYTYGSVPSHARAWSENLEGVENLFTKLDDGMRKNWGSTRPVVVSDEVGSALNGWFKDADGRVAEARLLASQTGNAAADFTLLLYPEKRNIDMALQYIYPYHFWYNRTYINWLKRSVANPQVLASYGRYRQALEKIHAGAPEWWKYNINTNELFGIDSENPLFFNLEQTLNPLQGLTGVDFDDPNKRTGWFTTLLQNMNKLGPSTWTPWSLATALALYMKGENDVSIRWAGVLIPQTTTLRTAATIATKQPVGANLPFFLGGMGPWERRRVSRALTAMDNEGLHGTAEILDTAFQQSGPIWDEAIVRQATERGPGQLASFFLGAGFKARTRSDMEIDQFYSDYYRFWATEPDRSSDEIRNGLEVLRQKYPFMDVLLLSRKGGLDRDRAFAYNVLARIPPAQSDDFAELVGVDPRLLSRFYEDKGHIEAWVDTDRDRFMSGIVDLAAVLDMPAEATRDEWNAVRAARASMQEEAKLRFGENIWERVDAWFGSRTDEAGGGEIAEGILARDPAIGEALDFQALSFIQSPTMSAYYTSIEKVEKYYEGRMWDALEKELGPDIWDKWDTYWFLVDIDPKEARAYFKANPELKRYGELKDVWLPQIEQKAIEVGLRLPDGIGATLRDIEGEMGLGALDVRENFPQVTPGDISVEMIQTALGENAFSLALDALEGEELPLVARNKLDEIALAMGLGDWQDIIGLLAQSAGLPSGLQPEPSPNGTAVDTGLQGALGDLGDGALPSLPGAGTLPTQEQREGAQFTPVIDMPIDETIRRTKEVLPGLKAWIFDSVGPAAVNQLLKGKVGGYAHYDLRDVRIGQRFARQPVPVLIEIASKGDISAFVHEMAHQLDTVGVGRRLSSSASFKKAVQEILDDPTAETLAQGNLVRAIQDFPGIGGNPLGDIPASGDKWGGSIELFAHLMSASGGNLRNIPVPLRPFYSRFMEDVKAEVFSAPRDVVPFGAGDELETLVGERTAFIVGESLSVSQGSISEGGGDLGITDQGLLVIRERARELGVDEDKLVKQVLRILGIDF